jgi:hypothetical protein
MKTLQLCLASLLIAAGCARASNVIVMLDTASLSGSPGDVLSFSGTITNNDLATIDLNQLDISIPGLFSTDGSPFLFGPFTVAGGQTTVDFTFFTISVDNPYTDPSALVTGAATVLGGVEVGGAYDGAALNDLGETTFSVNVEGGAASAPEVATSWTLLPAICFLLLVHRKMRSLNTRVWAQ